MESSDETLSPAQQSLAYIAFTHKASECKKNLLSLSSRDLKLGGMVFDPFLFYLQFPFSSALAT
jgi:hypothetical protein